MARPSRLSLYLLRELASWTLLAVTLWTFLSTSDWAFVPIASPKPRTVSATPAVNMIASRLRRMANLRDVPQEIPRGLDGHHARAAPTHRHRSNDR